MPAHNRRVIRRAGRLRRGGVRDGGGDAGSSVVEAVLIIPIIVILSMTVIQFALIWHGRHLAQAAADTAVTAAAGYRADPGAGEQAGRDYLTQVAPHLLTDPHLTVTDDAGGTVTARVDAHVLTVVPFANFHVTVTAAAPAETFQVGAR